MVSAGIASGNRNDRKSKDYIIKSLLAGGVAGCVAKTVTAPFDRVKILFQGSNTSFTSVTGRSKGTVFALRRIYATEGVLGWFKGHSAMIARIFPYAALNYMCFEQYKLIFLNENGEPKFPLGRLVAGSCAGASSVFFTYPLDLIRARLAFQVKTKRYKGISHTFTTMMKEGGIRALYRGFSPTIAGILPYAGISFYTYDSLKLMLRKYIPSAVNEDDRIAVPYQLMCGAVAGASAQTASYPLDVIRRRMQLAGMARRIPMYSGMGAAFKTIWKEEGIRGLFIGLSINYIKVVPAVSLSFVTYEFMKKQMSIS